MFSTSSNNKFKVSKLSDSWRNATITKRGGQRGGFGGVADLERKRQYRATENARQEDDSRYGMVFDREEMRRRPTRERSHSPSPRRGSYRGRYRERSHSRTGRRDSRERYYKERRGRDRRDDR